MKVTRTPEVTETVKTVVQEETFTVEFKSKELILFIAHLFGKMSGPKEKACGLSEEAGRELVQFYCQAAGYEGIESLRHDGTFDFDAKIVKQSDLCVGCR